MTRAYSIIPWDFPGGPVVKNPSCSAGDSGSTPGRGTKIPHAAGQLSPRASMREPACCSYRAPTPWSPWAVTREKPTREKPTRQKPVCRHERSCMPQLRFRVLQLRPDAAKEKKLSLSYFRRSSFLKIKYRCSQQGTLLLGKYLGSTLLRLQPSRVDRFQG